MSVGTWDTTKGVINVSSGNLNLNAGSSIKMNRETGTGANVITQSGGNVHLLQRQCHHRRRQPACLDMQSRGAGRSSNTYHLNGGTLTANQITATMTASAVPGGAAAAAGTRIFNFNGGTLKVDPPAMPPPSSISARAALHVPMFETVERLSTPTVSTSLSVRPCFTATSAVMPQPMEASPNPEAERSL